MQLFDVIIFEMEIQHHYRIIVIQSKLCSTYSLLNFNQWLKKVTANIGNIWTVLSSFSGDWRSYWALESNLFVQIWGVVTIIKHPIEMVTQWTTPG